MTKSRTSQSSSKLLHTRGESYSDSHSREQKGTGVKCTDWCRAQVWPYKHSVWVSVSVCQELVTLLMSRPCLETVLNVAVRILSVDLLLVLVPRSQTDISLSPMNKVCCDFVLYLWGNLAFVIYINHLVTHRIALFHYKVQQHRVKAKCFWLFSLLVQK